MATGDHLLHWDLSDAASNEGFVWPTAFEESREMLEGCILIYAFADLRKLAREGCLSDAEQKIMTLPADASHIMKVVCDNIDTLKSHTSFGDESVNFYLTALDSIQESLKRHTVDPMTGETMFHSTRVVVFDDEKSNTELVYGIVVNSARRRVSVGFRGSVTSTDFMTDAKGFLTAMPNPVLEHAGIRQPIMVSVHHGFREYLFGSRRLRRGWNSEKSKHEIIMGQVMELLAQNPGYRLYATGHSLGGALATLFAFEAAASADPRIPKPVTCISVASPKVGALSFRRAFQALERQGAVRCLRVANYKDLVTLLPDRGSVSFLYILCCQRSIYRHVGVELKLYRGGKVKFSRPTESTSYFVLFCQDWMKHIKHVFLMVLTLPFLLCCKDNFFRYHGCKEYMERLLMSAPALRGVYLNNIYREHHVVETTN